MNAHPSSQGFHTCNNSLAHRRVGEKQQKNCIEKPVTALQPHGYVYVACLIIQTSSGLCHHTEKHPLWSQAPLFSSLPLIWGQQKDECSTSQNQKVLGEVLEPGWCSWHCQRKDSSKHRYWDGPAPPHTFLPSTIVWKPKQTLLLREASPTSARKVHRQNKQHERGQLD